MRNINLKLFGALSLIVAMVSCSVEEPVTGGVDVKPVVAPLTEDVVPGELLVRFDARVSQILEEAGVVTKSGQGNLNRSGVLSVDEILDMVNGYQIERVFPIDTRTEETARKEGLHLWYRVRFAEEFPVNEVAEKLSALGEVSLVSYNRTIKRKGTKATPLTVEQLNAVTAGVDGFVELRPFKGFTYKFNATQYARFAEIGSYKTSQYTGGGAGGSLSNSRDYNYVIENIINYQVPIKNDDHSLNLTLVHSWDKDYMTKLAVDADQVPVDSYWWNMIGDGVPLDIERTVSESILVSYLARAQYSYKGRYIFNGSLRYDGSSRFGENNKWALFPSVAGAWRISEEPFMQNVRPVSDLKLRLSWGSVGNQSGIGNYTTLGNATSYDMEFGDKYIIGYLPGGSLPNPNLKWETTTSTNFGLDFGFLKNRIHGSIEGYLTRTTDLLVSRQIESVLGYSSILDNLGGTKTSGFEFSINADVISKKDFNWNVGLNISTFHNEIVRIDNRKDENGNYIDDVDNKWFIGHPINVYYDYRAEGIWQYDDFDGQDDSGKWIVKPTIDSDGDGVADKAIELKDVVEPGSVKLIDYNNDGKIDPSDRQIIERDPDFIAAFNTSLKWKGFDFYMDWYAVVGSVRRNEWLYEGDNGGSLQGKKNGIKVNYWTPSNPSNEFPRPIMGMWQSNQQSLAYQDASYLRLRTLSIGYTFPEKWLRNYNLRLALTATNLLTFTKYQSYNPEGNIESYPQPRQWAVSVNFNF